MAVAFVNFRRQMESKNSNQTEWGVREGSHWQGNGTDQSRCSESVIQLVSRWSTQRVQHPKANSTRESVFGGRHCMLGHQSPR